MPGKDYGPSGKWIHDRAHRILRKGDLKERYGEEKGKSIAYAIATQQAHKVGKSPKGFRTSAGVREAKRKYDNPREEYQKTASLTSERFVGALLEHPLRLAARVKNVQYQYQRGEDLRKKLYEALRMGYPASWAYLGIRPK